MVLLAHPPITNAQHSLRDSTNDPARAQTLREPRFREPSVVRGKQPPHHLGTAIKCPLWIPSIDATVPQALARGNESLAVRARRGQLSENDGREDRKHIRKTGYHSKHAADAQVRQTGQQKQGRSADTPPTPDTLPSTRSSAAPSAGDQPSTISPGGPKSLVRPSASRPHGSKLADCVSTRSEERITQLGIETELVISARKQEYPCKTVDDFVMTLAENHNAQVSKQHPRMQNTLRPYRYEGAYKQWCLVEDYTLAGSRVHPWGLELVSPIFRAFPGSRWREDVEATWKYLKDHYKITANENCSTHIHISLDPFFTLPEIKRIAQAVIHFEPAIEALVPPDRRENAYVKSNWLDSPILTHKNRSRSEVIAVIEAQENVDKLVGLFQRDNRNYAWNFSALFQKKTIEFRKPPASTTPEEVLSWAELALSFIQASIRCDSAKQLQKVPPTIGGLRWFISRSAIRGINETARMARLWAGKDPMAALEPVPSIKGLWLWSPEARKKEAERLTQLAEADERLIDSLKRTAREPYW